MSYLLIDTSYLNFYRYYATLQWYTRSHPDDNIDDNTDDMQVEAGFGD